MSFSHAVRDSVQGGQAVLSAEIMPVKAEDSAGFAKLVELVSVVRRCFRGVCFFSLTDTGPDRERVIETAKRLVAHFGASFAARLIVHLTCGGRSDRDVFRHAYELNCFGVRHVLALRGDALQGGLFQPHAEGYSHPNELMLDIGRRGFPFEFLAACYPAGYSNTPSDELWETMRRKQSAGAKTFVAQVTLEPACFTTHKERAVREGVTAPIVPGMFAVSTIARLRQVARYCGVPVPERLHGLSDPALLQAMTGIVRDIWADGGSQTLHLCTFNDLRATLAVLEALKA